LLTTLYDFLTRHSKKRRVFSNAACCVCRFRAGRVLLDTADRRQRVHCDSRGERHRRRWSAGATGRHRDRRHVTQHRPGRQRLPSHAPVPARYIPHIQCILCAVTCFSTIVTLHSNGRGSFRARNRQLVGQRAYKKLFA